MLDTGEGEIEIHTEDGTLEFGDENLVRFVGEAVIPCWGAQFSFTARKISNRPSSSEKKWGYYLEKRHDSEADRRWR